MSIDDKKRELRSQIRQKLKAIPPDERRIKSKAICQSIITLGAFKSARVVMLYMPYGFEVDISEIIGFAFSNKLACFPVIENGDMRAQAAYSVNDMAAGEYGILAPIGGNTVSPDDIDVIITPGLAFDANGGRLGKGGGFYDRFLHGINAVAIAPAFFEQVVDCVPAGENDIRIDVLATDRYVLDCRNRERV